MIPLWQGGVPLTIDCLSWGNTFHFPVRTIAPVLKMPLLPFAITLFICADAKPKPDRAKFNASC